MRLMGAMMTGDFLTPEEGAKLKVLREAYVEATQRAAAAIIGAGMSSEAFLKADREAGDIVRQIKGLLGTR